MAIDVWSCRKQLHEQSWTHPERLGVFAAIDKFLFRQRVLLMCSVNVDAAKGLNDLPKESSMKVGINLEQMEDVLKEPSRLGLEVVYPTQQVRDQLARSVGVGEHQWNMKKHHRWKPT